MSDNTTTTTPGYKTVAFWATIVLTVLTALLSSGALASVPLVAKIAGYAVALLVALGFHAKAEIVKKQ